MSKTETVRLAVALAALCDTDSVALIIKRQTGVFSRFRFPIKMRERERERSCTTHKYLNKLLQITWF